MRKPFGRPQGPSLYLRFEVKKTIESTKVSMCLEVSLMEQLYQWESLIK